jgi:hypothetical protein
MSLRKFMLACAPLAALTLAGCDVDVEDPGEAPEVYVEPGRAPDVDVDPADVDVRTEEREMTVPDVDIRTEERKVDVPTIDINPPDEDENEPIDE